MPLVAWESKIKYSVNTCFSFGGGGANRDPMTWGTKEQRKTLPPGSMKVYIEQQVR